MTGPRDRRQLPRAALATTVPGGLATVPLGPFHDAHGYDHTVYWRTPGEGGGPPVPSHRCSTRRFV